MVDNYRDLSLGKYLEICEVCRDESLEEIDKQVRMISILSGMSVSEILDLPIAKYKEMAGKTMFLTRPSVDDHTRIADTYVVGDFDLVPTKDVRKISTAQYIDFQTFSSEGESRLVEILSCFLIPKGRKYGKDYDVIVVQDAIRHHLSVHDALSLSAFFLSRYKALIRSSLIYSRRIAKSIKEPEKRETMLMEIERQELLLKTSGVG